MKKSNLLFIIIILFIISCKNENLQPEPENPDFDPKNAVESIVKCNSNEIGGPGLFLMTAQDEKSPLSKESFNTVVSKQGAQLLLVEDANNKVRALTLSIPNTSSTDILNIGAHSTAISLLFLTPGIMTSDIADANFNIQKIQNLSVFNEFVTYLRNNLNNKSIDDIVKQETYTTLFEKCINEYILVSTKKSTSAIIESMNSFEVNYNGNDKIELVNKGFRIVNVAQMDLDYNQKEIRTKTVYPDMNGNRPLSWGSVFTSSTFDVHKENIDFTTEKNASISDIWIIGPGNVLLKSYVIPESIREIEQPWMETVTYYFVLPLFDLIAGVTSSISKMTDLSFRQSINEIKAYKSIPPLAKAQNEKEFKQAIYDMSVNIIGATAGIVASGTTTGFLAVISAAAAKIIALTSIFISSVNLTIFVIAINQYDCYGVFKIVPPGGVPFIPTLKEPLNNSNGNQIPITCSWIASLNAKSYHLQISKFPDFSQVEIEERNIGALEKQFSNLQNGNKYYWRVAAVNGSASSPWSQVWNFTTGTSPTYDIGDSYAGGIIFYTDNTGQHGLIAAKTDQSSGIQWYNGSFVYVGATDKTIGAGQVNTTKIINVLGTGNYAASLCDNLVLEGYSDWFLPSHYELDEMFKNYEVLNLGKIETYWSSTDYGCSTSGIWGGCAFCRSYGFSSWEGPSSKHSVRAIRKF